MQSTRDTWGTLERAWEAQKNLTERQTSPIVLQMFINKRPGLAVSPKRWGHSMVGKRAWLLHSSGVDIVGIICSRTWYTCQCWKCISNNSTPHRSHVYVVPITTWTFCQQDCLLSCPVLSRPHQVPPESVTSILRCSHEYCRLPHVCCALIVLIFAVRSAHDHIQRGINTSRPGPLSSSYLIKQPTCLLLKDWV